MNKLMDICEIGDGAHASIKRCDEGILYLTSKNFTNNGLNLDKFEKISPQDYKKHFKPSNKAITNVKRDDIVFSIIGSIGYSYIIKKDDQFGISSSVAILRPKKDKVISKFLYYSILSETFQKTVINIKSGVAQSFLSLGMIKKLPILELPPLPTQKKIADILSAYDDLIDNNNRRIKILEQSAQELYKEWFVRFRFPGYKTAKFEKGLPVGWEVKKLGNELDITSSKRVYLHDYVDEGIPFYRSKEVIKLSSGEEVSDLLYITKEKYEEFKNKFGVPVQYDILLTSVGTIGVPLLITNSNPFYFKDGNLTWIKGNENKELAIIVYLYLKSPVGQDYIKAMIIGTSQGALTIENLKKVKILKPDKNIIQRFYENIGVLLRKIENLQTQNQNLKKQRDLLLPRLMSGKLEV